ncbi:unnamed protein product [Sphagnum balticum]
MQPKPRSSEVLRVGLSAILKRLFAEVIGSVRLLRSDLPLHSVLNWLRPILWFDGLESNRSNALRPLNNIDMFNASPLIRKIAPTALYLLVVAAALIDKRHSLRDKGA